MVKNDKKHRFAIFGAYIVIFLATCGVYKVWKSECGLFMCERKNG